MAQGLLQHRQKIRRFRSKDVMEVECICHLSFSICCFPILSFLFVLPSLRLVNELLSEELKLIHAFEQRTLTPEQWAKEQEAK